jgi:hypothetical protein
MGDKQRVAVLATLKGPASAPCTNTSCSAGSQAFALSVQAIQSKLLGQRSDKHYLLYLTVDQYSEHGQNRHVPVRCIELRPKRHPERGSAHPRRRCVSNMVSTNIKPMLTFTRSQSSHPEPRSLYLGSLSSGCDCCSRWYCYPHYCRHTCTSCEPSCRWTVWLNTPQIVGVRVLLWILSLVVNMDHTHWDETVVNSLHFLEHTVLQVPFFLMTMMRYVTPTLDQM